MSTKKPSTPKQSKKLYLIIQQGGFSREMYVHVHSSLKEAKADIRSCGKAAYNTSEPIEIPEGLSGLITAMNKDTECELWELLETVVREASELI